MDGNADCNNIEILAGGRMIGDISSVNLVIESQAIFEGYSKIRVAEGKTPLKTSKTPEPKA